MKKTGESDTHDMPSEYTVIQSKWSSTYTATEDVYVVVMIKYDKHGSINFSARSEEMKKILITIQ